MEGSPRFRALIFDMDGTLTVPTLDFRAIRAELHLPTGDLVTEVEKLPDEERAAAWAVIERHEEEAMRRQTPQAGGVELLRRCRAAGILVGTVTRNTRRSVDHFADKYGIVFDGIVTRDFRPVKPHPAPVLHLLRLWKVPPSEALMVGDYLHDVASGRAAGAWTCWFDNTAGGPPVDADFRVRSMAELERLVFG